MIVEFLERVLRLAIGDADATEGVIGDLREEYETERDGARGRWAHGFSLIRLAVTYAWARRERVESRAGGEGWRWEFMRETRLALRSLGRSPGFAVVAILTVALGVGANSVVFSVVDGILLRPADFENARRTVYVWADNPPSRRHEWPLPYPAFEHLRTSARTLEDAGVFAQLNVNTVGPEGAERITGAQVSASLFRVAGNRAQLGRLLTDDDDRPGASPVVVLSDGFWADRYGRDPAVLGRGITLGVTTYVIVGVLEPNFRVIEPIQVRNWGVPVPESAFYIPIAPIAVNQSPGAFAFPMLATLAPGATLEQARSEVAGLMAPIWREMGGRNATWEVNLAPYNAFVGREVRPVLILLLAAVVMMLVVVCATLSALFLVRGARRQSEWSVRRALGARPSQVSRYVWLESLLIAALGGLIEGALAWLVIERLGDIIPQSVPRLDQVRLDARVVAFTALASLAAGFSFGAVPARWTARRDPSRALGGRSETVSRSVGMILETTVAVEVALALVLLVVGSLLMRSFTSLLAADPGFETDGVLLASVVLGEAEYPTERDIVQFVRDAETELNRVVAADAVGASSFAFDRSPTIGVTIDGRDDEVRSIRQVAVIPGTLRTLRMRLVEGRGFDSRDDETAARVVMMSESLARRLWPDESPIGKRVSLGSVRPFFRGGSSTAPESREIVGVVGDVRSVGIDRAEPFDIIYIPWLQDPWDRTTWMVRFDGEYRAEMGRAVVAALATVDPTLPVDAVEPFSAVVNRTLARERFSALLLAAFAVAASALAAIGLYGVVAYTVATRTRDIGLRVALGAAKSAILSGVVVTALRPVGVGVVVGTCVALIVARLMEGLLFGVSPGEASTFLAAALGIFMIAACAAFVPARRASMLDALVALRAP
ncbi:MAG: ADOP family duplicated permease [Gemmatimonadetes bacterium]|nr:ADOP family duplicated permease [Gemmatimonadota bacterium]